MNPIPSPQEFLQEEAKKVSTLLEGGRFSHPKINEMYSHVIATGRRLRGVLLLLSCRVVGGDSEKLLPVAASIELIHKATLVHDDIIDESEIRRGNKTFHIVYEGELALVFGDLLYGKALDFLKNLNKNFNPDEVGFCYDKIAEAYKNIYVGQYLDLSFEGGNLPSEKEFLRMLYLKTGVLIETSAMIGTKLGGGTEKEIKALSSYAKNIAVGFQIQNDLNSILGHEKKMGLKQGTDIYQGKCSIPLINCCNSNEEAKQEMMRMLKKEDRNRADILKLTKILRENKSIEYAEDMVESLLSKARKSLQPLRESKVKDFLVSMTDRNIHKWYWS